MKIAACISTVNEAATIGALVSYLHARAFDVIVIDGGSKDGTWQIANDNGATVNVFDKPRGLKTHLLTGWQMALDRGARWIVQIDAGGSHDPQDAIRLVSAAQNYHADMVIGSRFCRGARYRGNVQRKIMSQLAAWLCSVKTGATFTDWTSGYRVYSEALAFQLIAAQDIFQAQMHGFQIETLNAARIMNYKIIETPITYRAGRSAFNQAVAWEALNVWQKLC